MTIVGHEGLSLGIVLSVGVLASLGSKLLSHDLLLV